jgi:hypothetical protein
VVRNRKVHFNSLRVHLPFLYSLESAIPYSVNFMQSNFKALEFPRSNCFFSSENYQGTPVRKLFYEISFHWISELVLGGINYKV